MGERMRPVAKITRPSLVKYHPRERVYGLLDGLAQYPVVYVTGPAGSGKTTLVNSYLKERGITCVWYKADGGDHDPATFFYYLREAAAVFSQGRKKNLPLLTPEYQPGLTAFTLRWFGDFFERIGDHAVLVIDNYHEVPETSVLHTVIKEGLSKVAPGTQVILMSRKDPPPEFSRLMANRQLATIGWNELRLEPGETEGIVGLVSSDPIPEKRIRDFHDLADGWAAGVVLMAQKSVVEDIEPGTILEQDPDDLFSYFASEVFNKMDPGMQDFLIRTSCLSAMSIEMARELTKCEDARRILNDLSRYNYFTERRFLGEAVYSYHPLFRHFLFTRAQERLSGEEMGKLVMDAAILLEKNGHVEEALSLARDAKCWEVMMGFILKHAKSMLNQGRHRTLDDWITGMPGEVLEEYPWLRFCLATSRLPFDPVSSLELFESAYDPFKQGNDVLGFFLVWSGIANSIVFGGKSRIPVETLLKDMEHRQQALAGLPSDDIRSLVVSVIFTLLVSMDPARVEPEGWDREALAFARKTGNIDVIILTFFFRIYHHLIMSRLQDAGADLAALNEFVRFVPMQDMRRIAVLLANTLYCTYAGSHEECLSYADKALAIADESGIHLWDISILRYAAMSCQDEGDYNRASTYLEKLMMHDDDPRPRSLSFSYAVRSRQAMALGRLKEAFSLNEKALHLASESRMPVHLGFVLCHKAWVCAVMGDEAEAQELMPEIESLEEKTGCRFIGMNLRFVRALIAFNRGDDEEGLGELRQGLGYCREYNGYPALVDHPPTMTSLLVRALEAGIEEDFAQEIIRRRGLKQSEQILGQEHWPWRVKIYTLGRFEVVKEGKKLKFIKKTQKKPLEMLKAIIIQGCFEVSEDVVADMLWPFADGDMAMRACTTTLHRLRKLLGGNDLIVRKNGLLSLDPNLCWVDARAFVNLLGNAEELREGVRTGGDRLRAEEASLRALSLYRGRFLFRESSNVRAISLSEELHEKYFLELYALANSLMDRSEWETAAGLLELGLTVDPCSEGCCQRYMVCLDAMGKKSEAMAAYERFRSALIARQGFKPAEETELLARRIRLRTVAA